MHHPSIVLWSGNNENEQAITEGWFPETKFNPYIYTIDYDILYHRTIRETFISLDKSRPYISRLKILIIGSFIITLFLFC